MWYPRATDTEGLSLQVKGWKSVQRLCLTQWKIPERSLRVIEQRQFDCGPADISDFEISSRRRSIFEIETVPTSRGAIIVAVIVLCTAEKAFPKSSRQVLLLP